jgi:hypothetical protein
MERQQQQQKKLLLSQNVYLLKFKYTMAGARNQNE